jgi:pilus assembly protein Flp/PilA
MRGAVHPPNAASSPSRSPLDIPHRAGFWGTDHSSRPDYGCSSRSIFTIASQLGGHHLPMIALVRKFCADETGATGIEYGLIAAGISLVIIAVVNGIGLKLNTKFSSINTSLK